METIHHLQDCLLYILLPLLLLFLLNRLFLAPLCSLPGPLATKLTHHALPPLSRTLTIFNLHTRHNSPIIRLSPTQISILSPESIKTVYSSPDWTKHQPLYSQFQHFSAPNAFSSHSKHEHGWRRKAVAAVYSQSHVLAAESVHQRIAAVVQEYLALIEAAADRSVEVYTVNTFFATDAISAHIFGRGISLRCLEGCKDDQGIVLRHYADDARARVFLRAEMPAVARVLEWVQGKGGEDPLEAWAWAAWKRWEVDPEAGVVVDLLNGRKGWTEADVGSEITDELLAGLDTTSDTLSFLQYALSQRPDIQKSLQASLPLHSPVENPYLHAVVMETIRLYPAVPVLLPRVAPADTVLDSFLIPAGTIVSSFAYGIHRDQSVFGSQYPVDEFVPERWLDTTERVGKMQQRFWGFGSGARSCVGRHQALLEIKMLIAAIYSLYSTEVDDSPGAMATDGHVDQWNMRKTFRDVLPFAGVKGVLRFIPRPSVD